MTTREKCGVFGVYSSTEEVFPILYWGMLAQNHRGHQSHGFATFNGEIDYYTELGLIPPIKEPGKESRVRVLPGKVGIANVRYTTSGASDADALCKDAMPIKVSGKNHEIVISFNGNIVNIRELQEKVGVDSLSSDTHALAMLLVQNLDETDSLPEAIKVCMESVDGAYSINYLLIDEYIEETGMRPDQLCLGCITNKYPTTRANELSQKMLQQLKEGKTEKGRIYENP